MIFLSLRVSLVQISGELRKLGSRRRIRCRATIADTISTFFMESVTGNSFFFLTLARHGETSRVTLDRSLNFYFPRRSLFSVDGCRIRLQGESLQGPTDESSLNEIIESRDGNCTTDCRFCSRVCKRRRFRKQDRVSVRLTQWFLVVVLS